MPGLEKTARLKLVSSLLLEVQIICYVCISRDLPTGGEIAENRHDTIVFGGGCCSEQTYATLIMFLCCFA